MGVVYSATQPVIEKRVAIKVLNAQYSANPGLVRRFIDEARAVNRIRHANIIDIFSFGQLADARQYFVMEYLEGATLADRLDRGDLSLSEAPPLLAQICDALDAAHGESIVHRDLKPENIWIGTPRRGRPFIKLLDFGIAKLVAAGDRSTTQTGVVMGTPHYMSPEQCHGRAVDHRTDIYAMGVLLYRLYTGRLPFDGQTFTEVITQQVMLTPDPPSRHAVLPDALDRLIMRCLSKDPGERPQSARELGGELAAIFAAATPAIAPPRPASPSSTTLSSSAAELGPVAAPTAGRPRAAFIAVAVGLAAVAVAVVALLATRDGGAPAPPAAATPSPSLPAAAQVPAPSPPAAAPAPLPIMPAAPTSPNTGATPADGGTAAGEAAAARTRRPVGKGDRTPGQGARAKPAPAPAPARSRATDTGLMTDNPFE
jgi:serine/threonine-protein kinase